MRNVTLAIAASLLFFTGCTASSQPAQRLVTIKYCLEPMRTFEVVGTDIKALPLDRLTETLKTYKAENPEAEYELLAEVKCMPEQEHAIRKAIRDAGITLKHYWAPVSFDGGKESPYGPGHVDRGG